MTEDGSDLPLEVIELEPAAPAPNRRERDPATTGVRRRKVPIIVAIVVVVGLVVSVIAGRSPRHKRSSAAVTSTTNARNTTINLRGGPLFASRVGAQLLTAGADGLRLVDTDTGKVTALTIAGLPLGPLRIVSHAGPTVAVSLGAYLYWFTVPDGVAHRVDATRAFPAIEPGHLWLATDTVATEVPGDPDRLPRSRLVTAEPAIGAVRGGLLEQNDGGRVVVEPANGHGGVHPLLPDRATVIGVHADRVAWVTGDCGVLRCPVHISETSGGTPGSSTWFQLPGHPSDLALQASTALFSPAGDRLAVVLPDDSVTRATTLVVGDLRTRTTTVVNTQGYLTAPGEAVGMTVDWTRDGNFIVLAPELGTGAGRLGAIDPANGRVLTSRVSRYSDLSVAATGTSAVGPLDLPRRLQPPITKGPEPRDAYPGLQLVGADATQVDVLDLGSGVVHSLHIGAVIPNLAGPFSLARVTTGWLVVRNAVVSLFRDGGDPYNAEYVDAGTQVLSARGGRVAWTALGAGAGPWRVSTYDPATLRRGPTTELSGTLAGAVDGGLVFTRQNGANTDIVLVDESGRQRTVTSAYSTSLTVLASGGSSIAYSDEAGLHVLDVTTGASQYFTSNSVSSAALSTDGEIVAWSDRGSGVHAARVAQPTESIAITLDPRAADRVLVADDGTVFFSRGIGVWQASVDATGSQRIYDLAPDPSTELALG